MAGIPRFPLVAATVAYAGLQWWGRTYGATRAERRAPMPGDELIRSPQTIATHAITIPAPPEEVWPWLVQMGWHRAGWYTARWVDVLFFPTNRPSADHILEEHQKLQVGDLIPDGPPEAACGFVVEAVEPGQHLVLQSTSHLPLTWRARGLAGVCWTWSFQLRLADDPAAPGRRCTRLVFRWRAKTAPGWLTAAAHLLIVPADAVMSRSMLHGIRDRAAGAVHAP
jgi:hypothetical protein